MYTKEEIETFGEALKLYRKQKRVSQQQLAQKLSLHWNTISAWECGEHLPKSRDLVLEIARQLDLDASATIHLLETSLTTPSPFWYVPYPRNPFFTGRADLLQMIHERLHGDTEVALSQFYALSGAGGIGKTQFALEYAYRYALEYRALFWLAAETEDTLLASFAVLARQLNLPEGGEKDDRKMVKAVLHWLAARQDWLLIFDNVESIAILKPFLPAARQGSVLITTRLYALDGQAHVLDLPPFPLNEGIRFLLHRANLLGPDQPLDDLAQEMLKPAQELVEALGGLPLALDQAGAYIEVMKYSLADYWQLYQSDQISLLDERFVGADHPHSVLKTFQFSFTQLACTNQAAADLLRVCAFLAPEAIPADLFTRGADHLGPVLAPVASDPYLFNQALGETLRYALLRRHSQDRTLSLHRLVQVALKAMMDEPTYQRWATRTVEALAACVSLIEGRQIWLDYARYLPHAQHAIQLIQELQLVSPAAATVLFQTGKYVFEHAQYAEAERHYLQAISLLEKLPDSDYLLITEILSNLGNLYREQGKYEQACQTLVRCVALHEQEPGVDPFKLIGPLKNLAIVYAEQGEYDQAEPIFLRCLHICEAAPASDDLQTPGILNNLANIYHLQGKHAQAEPLYRRALSIWEQALDYEQPRLGNPYSNLGTIYRIWGKYEQAESFYLRAVHIWEQALGSDHPNLGLPLGGLGDVYLEQRNYAQAEPLYRRVLQIWEQTLGTNHPRLGHPLGGLGDIYLEQRNYEQAELFYLRALRSWEQAFGADHPLSAHCLYGLGNLYRTQGKYTEALAYYQQALTVCEHSLGEQHQETAATLHGLACLFSQADASQQAEEYAQRALAIRKQVLGTAHPFTRETQALCQELLALREGHKA